MSRWQPLRYLSLKQGYLLALGLIMVISTCKFIAMEKLVSKQDAAAVVINVSGQQRMLSQRIAYYATALVVGDDVEKELQETLEEFTNNHRDLIFGDEVRGLPKLENQEIHAIYFHPYVIPAQAGTHASELSASSVVENTSPLLTNSETLSNGKSVGMDSRLRGNDGGVDKGLDNMVQQYIAATRSILNNNPAPLAYIAKVGPNELLKQLNQVVKLHEEKARDDIRFIANAHIAFWVVTTLILILEALYLFRPMIQKIETSIQELKKREDKIKTQFQELERFTYISSHDLQEPLRKIIGFNQRLQMDLGDKLNDKTERYLHFINIGALHMRELVHGLRDYARILASEEPTEPVDSQLIAIKLAEQHPTVKIYFNNLPTLDYNPRMLNQLFDVLVDNAITYQAPERPPEINISAENKDTHWQFCFADNGIGVDEKFYEKIFVIFQRLHRKEDIAGIGLGLAMARKIVERHGGKIWLESQPETGSQFYFTTPKTPSGALS